jgi:hypothetical protein
VVERLGRVLLLLGLGVRDAVGPVLVVLGEVLVVVVGLEVAAEGFVAVVLRVLTRLRSLQLVVACGCHFGSVGVAVELVFAAVVRFACFVAAFRVPG